MVKDDFFWIGGALWLDFVNTEVISGGKRIDLQTDSGALLDWLQHSGAVPTDVIAVVRQWSQNALDLLQQEAHELRATLRDICEEFAGSGHLSSAVIDALNERLRPPAPGLKLEPSAEGKFGLLTQWSQPSPHQLLYPLAQAAAETLSGPHLNRLRKCASDQCILWFLDTSKNGQRRWCSMEICGNRHKVSEHNRRKKEG